MKKPSLGKNSCKGTPHPTEGGSGGSGGGLIGSLVSLSSSSRGIPWQGFRTVTFLDKGLADKLIVHGHKVSSNLTRTRPGTRGRLAGDSSSVDTGDFYFSIGNVDAFESRLDGAQQELDSPRIVSLVYTDEVSTFRILFELAPTIAVIGFLYCRAKLFNKDTQVKVKFKDVAGMDETKQKIMKFIQFLKEPSKYERRFRVEPFFLVCRAQIRLELLCRRNFRPIPSVSGSELVEMFVGVGSTRGNDKPESTQPTSGGFETIEYVVVLAGTNRADILDPALMRPETGSAHAGFPGADIANVCNEVALRAACKNSESVESFHFDGAIERVIFLEHVDPVLKVSIIVYLPPDRYLQSSLCLGGRVSVEIFFGVDITGGAQDDLQKVTRYAFEACANYGWTKSFSKKTAKASGSEVRKMITTRALLNKEDLEKLAELLLAK
ncbi:hypothetical protein BDP27DRAFT_1388399 [Rhodocollybia butyracea]|uniref:Peptidase M41 domain-containing protein n=1 Tax=Rhodocollybia butyracea TaxID=206335 RepID=A0A9P5Q546_9AGAR|nr:hypothetical protein BDP27DRAFT_1388399 [Rhodocollybia butyracea]